MGITPDITPNTPDPKTNLVQNRKYKSPSNQYYIITVVARMKTVYFRITNDAIIRLKIDQL